MDRINKEAIEAAMTAYWHEVHNGGGYSEKCYEAAISAAVPFLSTLPIAGEREAALYQDRVAAAHHAIFHDDPTDVAERLARYAEETNEVLQAFGMSREDMHRLVDYTCDRPAGEPAKEIGAAMLTLTSLCVLAGYDLMSCAEADLEKLQRPETIDRIRAKRSTRHGRGPLPGFDPSSRGKDSEPGAWAYEDRDRADAAMAQAAASDLETTASSHPVPKQGLPLLQGEGRAETVAGTDRPGFHESAKISKSCHENTSVPEVSAAIDRQTKEYAAALQSFIEYFARNYPGPNTVIHDPDWHAPKIFRAAVAAIRAAATEGKP